jgi:hypothetical protein
MKRISVIVLALLFTVSFAGMVYAQTAGGQLGPKEMFDQKFAQQKAKPFEGTVVSHDVACHCVVIKGDKGTLTMQDDYAKFEGDYDRAKGLKIGSKAKGTYKTVDYINYIVDIHGGM